MEVRAAVAFRDQLHRLKLELPRKLPSFHDPPPVPSKHLTRCLPNRQQANHVLDADSAVTDHAKGRFRRFSRAG
jgi:hypothetical protein